MKHNIAKINLTIENCRRCPFVDGEDTYYCKHALSTPNKSVGDGEGVPDFCPFVLQRLKSVIDTMNEATSGTVPRVYLTKIERKQRDDPDPKFGADHSYAHARRVYEYGTNFLEELIDVGCNSPDYIQKQKLLLWIAVQLHDIGLAETAKNHASHSAELARKYFAMNKVDIDSDDAQDIVHAIYNHSDGSDTQNLLDAALLLGDKLDVTKDRIVRITDSITNELAKIEDVEYKILRSYGKATRVDLKYTTNDKFDVAVILRSCRKNVIIPKMVTEKFLAVPFHFIVNGEEVDITTI